MFRRSPNLIANCYDRMTQKQLAEKMNCSQQYISKILKGKDNLSLETLSKIEDALGIQILTEDTVLYTQLCSE